MSPSGEVRVVGSGSDPRIRAELLVLAAAFALSRLLLPAGGGGFDLDAAARLWQLADPDLLRDDLARTLFYLHGQPPLFNLLVGLALKAAGSGAALLLGSAYFAAGLLAAASLYATLRALFASRLVSALATASFSLSPAALSYERWLFYPHLEASLLACAAFLLARYARHGRRRDGLALFVLGASLVLLRSYVHPAWLLAVLGIVLAARPRSRRLTLALAAAPLALCVAWYAKNLSLYGSFTGSTWLGMSASRITIQTLPHRQRRMLVEDGVLSPLARHDSFDRLEAYGSLVPPLAATGIPLLDKPYKANGRPNFNHAAYIELSRRYLVDAVALVRHRPRVYLRGLRKAWARFFGSPTDDLRLAPILAPIAGYNRFFDRAVYGRIGDTCLLAVIGAPLLVGHALWSARRSGDPALSAVAVFAAFDIAYVAVVGNAVELGENNRFRFAVEPLLALLLGLFLARVHRWLRGDSSDVREPTAEGPASSRRLRG